jgi:predicted Zn-dependent peptidase
MANGRPSLSCLLAFAFCLLTWQAYGLPLYRDSLPNGLVVLTYEDQRLPLAHLAVVCRSGAAFDPAGKAGLANLTGDVLCRGTRAMTGDSVSSIVEYLGAGYYSTTDFDRTSVILQLLSKDLGQGLDLLANAVMQPAFADKDFAEERDRELENARGELDDPRTVADAELNRLLFPGHPYGNPVLGDTGTLSRLKPADLAEHHRQHFVPNNCFVIGVGDLKRDEFLAQVTSRFSGWQPAPVPKLVVPTPKPPDRLAVKLITRPDMNQSYIAFGHLGIAMADSDMMATRLAAWVLGGSPIDSRLGLAVREEGGLAYDVRCSFDRRNLTGAFRASVQTAKPAVAIEKMFYEVQLMYDSGAKAAELADGKGFYTGNFPLTYSSGQGKLDRVTELEVYRFGTDWLEKYPDQVRAVTREAANAAARRHLHPGRVVVVVLGNATREDLGLKDVEWIE